MYDTTDLKCSCEYSSSSMVFRFLSLGLKNSNNLISHFSSDEHKCIATANETKDDHE